MPYIKALLNVRPKSLVILAAIINAATKLGLPDMYVTHGRDGKHKVGSKHGSDEALDFRTHHLHAPQQVALVAEMKIRLGPDYDVILEDRGTPNEHGHAEYDPKA